jgi:hypothetical protein
MKNSALSKEAAKTIAKAKRIEEKKSAAQQAKPPEREVSLFTSLSLSLSHSLDLFLCLSLSLALFLRLLLLSHLFSQI